MGYKFYFDTREDAKYFIDRAQEIAKNYGTVSLGDLNDLAGIETTYLDRQVIWTYSTIFFDTSYVYSADKYRYCVQMPEPDQYPAPTRKSYKDYYRTTTPHSIVYTKKPLIATPEPFNITILMDPSKDPYTTIREVIQQANEIKDRPVFITID